MFGACDRGVSCTNLRGEGGGRRAETGKVYSIKYSRTSGTRHVNASNAFDVENP